MGLAKPCALARNPDLNLQPGEKVTHKAQGHSSHGHSSPGFWENLTLL